MCDVDRYYHCACVVDVCAVLCCFGLSLYSLTMMKEFIEMLYLQEMELGERKLIPLNVRGLSNFKKRKSILAWCKKQKLDIIFFQGNTLEYSERKTMEN